MDKSSPLFKAAAWVPHTSCPACGSVKVSTYKSMPAESAARVRFHKCRTCKALFKSVENVSKI